MADTLEPTVLRTTLPAFVLRVAAWLAPAFLVWYVAAAIFAWPIGLLTEGVAKLAFAEIVRSVEQHGYLITIVSSLKVTAATGAGQSPGVISVDLNPLLYGFGFPMFAALTLAARQGRPWRTIILGYFALAPFVTWGVVAEFLRHVTFDIPASVASGTGFGPMQREAIAFAYQFGSLILPAVAPAVMWVLTHRRFLETFAARARGA